MYKASKDQVSVFGLRTQFGGGKTTGFALVYDSPEAMKKFEPHFRLVRVGMAKKIEKASRQQRMYNPSILTRRNRLGHDRWAVVMGKEETESTEPETWNGTGNLGQSADFDLLITQQASNARTDRRPSVAQPRSRAPRPRRRNKRLAPIFRVRIVNMWSSCCCCSSLPTREQMGFQFDLGRAFARAMALVGRYLCAGRQTDRKDTKMHASAAMMLLFRQST